MTDQFRIDSHKLMYHVNRVKKWLDGELIYPIYMEVSPCGSCNHRCSFCSVDFMGYQKKMIDAGLLKKRITELGSLGLKSIMFAGEGEPFLHKQLSEIIVHTKKTGIDVAVTTNGVLMRPEISEKIIASMAWVKVSLNAGQADTYAEIHQTQSDDFGRVLKNIEFAAKVKQNQQSRCAIGVQLLLLPENVEEVETLAQRSKDAGADYLVVKPYTHHHKNDHHYKIEYSVYNYLEKALEKYNSDAFSVIFRARAMKLWDKQTQPVSACVCLPFWSYIDAGGNVWGCSAHLLEETFKYGSIKENTFKEIWEGQKRAKSLKWVSENLDLSTCKLNCRMGQVNKYLNELIEPPEHVNFI
ncbi:radical SAM protein [Desulfobacter latus]|uniref:Radical SAM protein n=1 Tax=Desulfobacter latus TaxID=2292 RepID=A0A850SZT6_9BACT|nr:radical SAM protein [Desulfobacter latus]NWH04953.1 radical SAM protein [Desulfobacter latus]